MKTYIFCFTSFQVILWDISFIFPAHFLHGKEKLTCRLHFKKEISPCNIFIRERVSSREFNRNVFFETKMPSMRKGRNAKK